MKPLSNKKELTSDTCNNMDESPIVIRSKRNEIQKAQNHTIWCHLYDFLEKAENRKWRQQRDIRGRFEIIAMLYIFMVVVTRLYIFPKTHRTALRRANFTICKLHFSNLKKEIAIEKIEDKDKSDQSWQLTSLRKLTKLDKPLVILLPWVKGPGREGRTCGMTGPSKAASFVPWGSGLWRKGTMSEGWEDNIYEEKLIVSLATGAVRVTWEPWVSKPPWQFDYSLILLFRSE